MPISDADALAGQDAEPERRRPGLRFALLAAATAAIIAAGVAEVWMIFLITLLIGIVFAPDSTARQVYAVDLVGAERLASALAAIAGADWQALTARTAVVPDVSAESAVG